MNSKTAVSRYVRARQLLALSLSVLLIPAAQGNLYAQASNYIALNAVQLDQLVAPISLYPDSLVASILTGSTYPDQVTDADNWLNQNMNLPPDQRANIANGMNWDPSVKALVAFPAVLDNLAKNASWTSQLGNAYFNQPGDVMNAVQAMRLQAQQSNVLVTTPQQRVYVDNGAIVIVPVNPAVVYVPYYNPWRVWGGLFGVYPGWVALAPPPGVVIGLGLGFAAVGIGIGLYAHYGWGFHAWAPSWGGGTIAYGGRPYISRSVTVINHGNFGGHETGAFEHGGRGVPGGFHAGVHVGAAREAAARGGAFRAGERAGAARAGAFRAGERAGAARAGGARPGGAGARPGGAAHVGGARPGGVAGAARAGGARPGGAAGGRPGGAAAARPSGGGARPGGGGAARVGGGARPSAPAARSGGGGGRAAAPAARGGGGAPHGGGGGGGGHHK